MFPYLAKIGPVLIPTHAVTMFAGYLIGTIGFFVWCRRLGIDREKLLNWMLICGLASIIGARLSAVIFLTTPEQFTHFLEHPIEILNFWRGGMSLYGIVFGTVVAGIWYAFRSSLPIWKLSDIICTWVAWGFFIQSFGCLGAGCHPGSPTDLPWGIAYYHPLFKGPKGIPLHPFPIYLALIAFVGIFLAWSRTKAFYFPGSSGLYPVHRWISRYFPIPVPTFEGDFIPVAGMFYGFWRFFAEFTRAPEYQIWYPGFSLPQSQMACILLFCWCAAFYLVLWVYRDCHRNGTPYPKWLKWVLKFTKGLEWICIRLPWPIREKNGG